MKHQLNKAAQEPLKAGPDVIELSNKVKYLGGVLDNTLNFLHWLPIQQRITYKLGLLTFKCIKKAVPKYLQEFITIRKPTQENIWSNNTGPILEIPKLNIKHFLWGHSNMLHQNMEFFPITNKNI